MVWDARIMKVIIAILEDFEATSEFTMDDMRQSWNTYSSDVPFYTPTVERCLEMLVHVGKLYEPTPGVYRKA